MTSTDRVRVSVTRIDLDALDQPGQLVLDVYETAETAATRAIAWAQVRGYTTVTGSIERLFAGPPPAAGFQAILNKPHSLLILATWPWCTTSGKVAGQH